MSEPTTAIPQGGEDTHNLQDLTQIPGGELPSTSPEASDALDALLAQKQVEKGEAPEVKPDPAPAPEVKPDPAPAPTPEVKPDPAPAPAPEVKPEARTFETVETPPNIKPKTAEAFATIKTLAKQAVTAAEERAAAAEKRALELEESAKTAKALTPEVEKELEQLRDFRKSLEVESDPEFKAYDVQIAANEETILARLKQAGGSDELIARVKEIGVAEVNWDDLAGKLPPSLRRLVDAKLVENESLSEQKKQAVAKAKSNSDEFFKARTEAQSRQAQAREESTRQEIDKNLPKMTWLTPKPVPTDAKPEEKAALEAHNKLVLETKEDMQQAIADDSPSMRAVLVLSYAQLRRVRTDFEQFQAVAAAKEKQVQAQIETLTKERDEAKKFVERVKGASTSRIHSSAPSSDTPAPKTQSVYTDAASAIDAARDEILARKAANQD